MCKVTSGLGGWGQKGNSAQEEGSTPQLPGQGRTARLLAWPPPQQPALNHSPGRRWPTFLHEQKFSKIFEKKAMPKSDKTDPRCKITLPRFAYATDQNCPVIPVLPLEQKITIFHMQTNTALDCIGLKLRSLSPKAALCKDHSSLSLSLKISCDPKHDGQNWTSTLRHITNSAQHTELCKNSTQLLGTTSSYELPNIPTQLKSSRRAEYLPNNNNKSQR